jgi:hypothetical protein
MEALLLIDGGPLAGSAFRASLLCWPPPTRLMGQDIHRDLCGTYELVMATDGSGPRLARYSLREDEDYLRLVVQCALHRWPAARGRLNES